MGLLGIQFVISLIIALFLQKLSPYYSLARWIMCSGLYRYLHPTNDELKALVGKPVSSTQPKGKRRRQAASERHTSNGRAGGGDSSTTSLLDTLEKFSIPCSTDIDMQISKIEECDVYSQYKYQDFKWSVDFSFCATLVFIFIEIAGWLRPQVFTDEFPIGFMWCLMAVHFAVRDLFTLTAAYWRSADAGERSMTVSFGIFFLVAAMAALLVSEDILDFELERGYADFSSTLVSLYRRFDFLTTSAPSVWTVKILMAVCAAVIGALACFPGIRYANVHLDLLYYAECERRWMWAGIYYSAFFAPVALLLLWVKPLTADLVVCDVTAAAAGNRWPCEHPVLRYVTTEVFVSVRLMLVLAFCLGRFLLTRRYLQAYLDSARSRVRRVRLETGRVTNVEIQRKVVLIFYYLSAAALQILTPVLLVLFLALMLYSLTHNMAAVSTTTTYEALGRMAGSSAETREYARAFRSLFSVPLARAVVTFSLWWALLVQFVMSCFGVFYLKYLA